MLCGFRTRFIPGFDDTSRAKRCGRQWLVDVIHLFNRHASIWDFVIETVNDRFLPLFLRCGFFFFFFNFFNYNRRGSRTNFTTTRDTIERGFWLRTATRRCTSGRRAFPVWDVRRFLEMSRRSRTLASLGNCRFNDCLWGHLWFFRFGGRRWLSRHPRSPNMFPNRWLNRASGLIRIRDIGPFGRRDFFNELRHEACCFSRFGWGRRV
jgi:hypothetical protein